MLNVNKIVKSLTKISSQLEKVRDEQERVVTNSRKLVHETEQRELQVQAGAKKEINSAMAWLRVLPSVK